MEKLKVVHTLYSGLGGHANVIFPLLEGSFSDGTDNTLIFFGVEETLPAYKSKADSLGVTYFSINKKPQTLFECLWSI